jgi:hypothetical protein
MKKITSVLLILLSFVMIASAMTIGASASAYQTYTYSISGSPLYSPDAYTAVKTVDYVAMGMEKDFKNPQDIITDKEGRVYIADTDNSRVVCLDRYYNYMFELAEFVNGNGNTDKLNKIRPQHGIRCQRSLYHSEQRDSALRKDSSGTSSIDFHDPISCR